VLLLFYLILKKERKFISDWEIKTKKILFLREPSIGFFLETN
jgi:hypothetical protein